MIIKITKGDNYPPTTLTVTKLGVPFDCTGSTAFFYIRNFANDHIYREPCTIDGTKVSFSFTPDSTSEAGVFKGNGIVTFPDGTSISIPNNDYITVIIRESVSSLGGIGNLVDQNYMKISTYDSDYDGIVDVSEKLSHGISGKSYSDIHGELLNHTAITTAHHSNVNDPTINEKAALDAAFAPSIANRFVTFSDLAANLLSNKDIEINVAGNLSPYMGILPSLIGRDQIITGVKGFIQVLPTGQNIVFDIRKNDPSVASNSIFTTTPIISSSFPLLNGVYQFDFSSLLNNNKICSSVDILYVTILQVGSIISGGDLCINVLLS